MKTVYIAAADGVHLCRLSDDGILTHEELLPCGRTMYLAEDTGRLFILLRAADTTDGDNSAVEPYFPDPQGLLTDPCPALTTGGLCGCHLSVLDNVVYAANYISGSVARMPLDGTPATVLSHTVHGMPLGPNADRQECPHPHFIAPTPDGRFLLVCDLGLDVILTYDPALQLISAVTLPAGNGPRHLCFSADGRYVFCANELSSTLSVLVFDSESGTLTHLADVTTRASDHGDHPNYPAAIRCTESQIFVSNRGDNDVAVFRIPEDGSAPLLTANLPCGGAWPRDVAVTDGYLVCTCEHSDCITVLDAQSGAPVSRLDGIPAPIAALVV